MSLDLIVIVVYVAVMLFFGWVGYRRAGNNEEFLVAGRRLGPMFYMGTPAAVVLGGASTIGGVSLGYTYGISGMWMVFWLGVGIVALSVLFAGTLTRMRVYSLPEMLQRRYGTRTSRVISGVVMIAYDLMVAVTSVLAIGAVANVILGIPQIPAILIGGAVVVIYSVLGGMWSISLTDIIQFLIMTVGIFLVLLPTGVLSAGGWSGLKMELPESYFSLGGMGIGTIVTYFLIYILRHHHRSGRLAASLHSPLTTSRQVRWPRRRPLLHALRRRGSGHRYERRSALPRTRIRRQCVRDTHRRRPPGWPERARARRRAGCHHVHCKRHDPRLLDRLRQRCLGACS